MKDIDRLFSDALQGHTTTPPAGLWERVESTLPTTSGRQAWFRWAAVLVPAFVAAGIWLGRAVEQPAPLAAEKTVTTPSVTPPASKQEPVAVNTPGRKRINTGNKVQQTASAEIPAQAIEVRLVEEMAVPEEITIEPIALDVEETTVEPETDSPIVLVYTLEPVVAPGEAAQKETSLDRVVEFARAVKHSDPIADIRGLKDELFAFDFRKKQTKKN